MQISHARSGARILGLALAALAIAVPAAQAKKDVKVQLLGFNDFHGQLEALDPVATSSGRVGSVPAGGAEYFATHVRAAEKGVKNSLVVAAGDNIGASPFTSALFHDEPTIEALNKIGLDITSVGNHEFDEGEAELLRMQNGGCHPNPEPPSQTCANGRFRGADFRFLAANVVQRDSGKTLFKPYTIRKFQGERIGFIGMTLEGTPDIVSPSGITNLRFLDEADTANKYAAELRRKGVKSIVVLLHEGGTESPLTAALNDCNNLTGPINEIVNRTTDDVDLFVTGHTHQEYNCVIDGRPVTSAFSLGRVLTDIDLTIDRKSGDIDSVSVNNEIVTRDVAKAADMTTLITRYQELAAPIGNVPVGRISADILREPRPASGEWATGMNPLGNLIADAQLADTAAPDRGDADFALMNPGGVRADLGFSPDGVVTYAEAFAVQPFNNIVVTQSLTGAQILEVLKDQWCTGSVNVLLPSASLTYAYSHAAADALEGTTCSAGQQNPVSNVRINGTPIDTAATYRVTTNNFLADGGDSFPSLKVGTNRHTQDDFDIDSLVRYLEPSLTGTPIAPPAANRSITVNP